MSRTTKRNIIIIVVAVLAAVFVSTLIGTLSHGYDDIFEPSSWGNQRNPDNLILVSEDDVICNTGAGTTELKLSDFFDVSVNGKGVVSIDGDGAKEDDLSIVLWSSNKLAAGTYTFSCESKGTFKGNVNICTAGSSAYIPVSDDTFTVTAGTTYYLVVTAEAGQEIDATFKPVLVSGDKAGSFYAE